MRVQKIRQWFHYRSRGRIHPVSVIPPVFTIKHPRKVVRLTRAQAYSRLFCKQGTPLHAELREAWELYTAGDDDTLIKYRHLFPGSHKPDMEFVTFQQVVLKEKVMSVEEEELTAVDNFIDKQYEEQKEHNDRPWSTTKVDPSQSEADLERRYVEQ